MIVAVWAPIIGKGEVRFGNSARLFLQRCHQHQLVFEYSVVLRLSSFPLSIDSRTHPRIFDLTKIRFVFGPEELLFCPEAWLCSPKRILNTLSSLRLIKAGLAPEAGLSRRQVPYSKLWRLRRSTSVLHFSVIVASI